MLMYSGSIFWVSQIQLKHQTCLHLQGFKELRTGTPPFAAKHFVPQTYCSSLELRAQQTLNCFYLTENTLFLYEFKYFNLNTIKCIFSECLKVF